MDTEAQPIGNDLYILTDLLGRKIGSIVQTSAGYLIEYDLPSKLDGIAVGPHPTLDEAMAIIERKTGGQCRRVAP